MKCKLISVIFKMECQNLKLFYATWTSMKRYSVQKNYGYISFLNAAIFAIGHITSTANHGHMKLILSSY